MFKDGAETVGMTHYKGTGVPRETKGHDGAVHGPTGSASAPSSDQLKILLIFSESVFASKGFTM